MSKKSKQRSTSQRRVVLPSPVPTETAASAPAKPAAIRSSSQEFNPDYSYVISDLKRIGVLAASFIAVLVVLSFILK
ncbi:MAG: hypothetical protein WHV66_10800 [Anaerolineales bacterium]